MLKSKLDYVLLFVADPLKSASFYSSLFALQPVEATPAFALFILENGVKLGLWATTDAQPTVTAKAGATELCFVHHEVDKMYTDFTAHGIAIAQHPTEMDFGYTFVALDLDGHRIRIFKPGGRAQKNNATK